VASPDDPRIWDVDRQRPQRVISDQRCPSSLVWKHFFASHFFAAELVHYITEFLVFRNQEFTPPVGGQFYLHGGRALPPPYVPGGSGGRGTRPPPADPCLFYVHHLVKERAVSTTTGGGQLYQRLQQEAVRTAGRDETGLYPTEALSQLREGELACLYYSTFYREAPCFFVSPDGDMLLQLLLQAPDRIDPQTGRFRNQHILRLLIPGGQDEFVDINRLYMDIMADEELRRAGVADPITTLCGLGCLMKNDFIHGYAYGIGTYREPGDPERDIPFIYQTFLNEGARFSTMLRVLTERGSVAHGLEVLIDEERFIEFTQRLYIYKYRKPIATYLKCSAHAVTIEAAKRYLVEKRPKQPRCHMMSRSQARVFARQLQWVLEYWLNGYRGQCAVEHPLLRFQDLPYYGWTLSPNEETGQEHVITASKVAPPRRSAGGHPQEALLENLSLTSTGTATNPRKLGRKKPSLKLKK
jgi:hypothetical protein